MLDIGVIDVETCKPLPNVLVDIWQANATGGTQVSALTDTQQPKHSLINATQGHPVPYPHLRDEKPVEFGKRKGLLSAFPRTRATGDVVERCMAN
jgi:hypothetical protein